MRDEIMQMIERQFYLKLRLGELLRFGKVELWSYVN
ncbi:hypothetical protein EUBVEN_01111 [Eubacterium ventriosum ATCC 27560]|uniref:Uncharacterized protein n=1 Tax=Eubacterium ventriosum ATCC 27560 TaxID=411463 RepID=A5Z5X9_9FIRM|nr:hypothetical protein EUBVEN_01111 [Eubacterium ventriosum ATCC 27560]